MKSFMQKLFVNPGKKELLIIASLWLVGFICLAIASEFFKDMNLMLIILLGMSFFSVINVYIKYLKLRKKPELPA